MLKLLRRRRDPEAGLKELLNGYELPPLPSSVVDVLSLLRDPDVPMAGLAARVETDAALTVKVLRLVNSAGFGMAKEVRSVEHAVSLLGRARLEAMVLAVAAAERLPRKWSGMESAHFWNVAVQRANLARASAAHLHPATQAESFTAALLLDIGIPVLAEVRPADYPSLLEAWRREGGDLAERERAALGFDHARVGGLLAREWQLPAYLASAIGGHHDHGGADGPEPAVRLASLLPYDDPGDAGKRVVEEAVRTYGLDEETARRVVEETAAGDAELARLLAA